VKKVLALDFPPDVAPFQSKEVGHYFYPWTILQENKSSLL